MDAEKIEVLVIRESQNTHSALVDRLVRDGCECSFAASRREIDALLGQHGFDLVLGPIRLKNDSLYPLMDLFDGTHTTLFYSLAVENGCWWLPALQRGTYCFGAPALRAVEFVAALDATIERIRCNMRGLHIASHPSGSAVKRAHSGGAPGMESPASVKRLTLVARKALG